MEGKSGAEQKVLKNFYRANLRGQKFEIETEFGTIFQDSRGMYMVNKTSSLELPKISVVAETHPAAYELALIGVWKHGAKSRTHYDQKDNKGNYLYTPSIEATVEVDIKNPLKEPRVHKFIPGGYDQLESYRQEVVEGHRDACINPLENKWTYTYHERLRNWNPSTNLLSDNRGLLLERGVDQIELVVQDLKRDLTSKGAQATTWIPTADPMLESNRPCLQRIWFRAYEHEDEIGLNANWYFRSRDIKAWFMNGWANVDLVCYTANRLSKEIGRVVDVKRIGDKSDSLHFYGMDQKEFEARFESFKSDENFEKRILRSDDETFLDIITEEKLKLEINPHYKSNRDSQRELAEKIVKDKYASERDKKFVRKHFPEIAKKGHWWREHNHFMPDGIE